MKKIDFHIHTFARAGKDSAFYFELEKLHEYIEKASIDAIAITNHNCFERSQFEVISSSTDITVFPGIEVDYETGHLLIISDGSNLDDFETKCSEISSLLPGEHDFLTFDELRNILVCFDRYLLIPHYDKTPKVASGSIEKFGHFIYAGEVASPNKFERMLKKPEGLTPVLFSDVRISDTLMEFPLSQTYLDIEEVSLGYIKAALRDKSKVFLNSEKKRGIFTILNNGTKASTGLNIVLGKRSSGKTHTLDEIFSHFESVKYIEQFSLIEKDRKKAEKDFKEKLANQNENYSKKYLDEFKVVCENAVTINLNESNFEFDKYLSSLREFANGSARKDHFAKTPIFQEQPYPSKSLSSLVGLVQSVKGLLSNTEYQSYIEKHIPRDHLLALLWDLSSVYKVLYMEIELDKRVNSILKSTKDELASRSSINPIYEVDLVKYVKDQMYIYNFEALVEVMKKEIIIEKVPIYDYTIIVKRKKIENAKTLHDIIKRDGKYLESLKEYAHPYSYLRSLNAAKQFDLDQLYKCFVVISYDLVNKYGFPVSGGERAEYNLEEQLKDANEYEMLLIDEPESSFDNVFLNTSINQRIKDLSKIMPVFVATHNSTIGASILPDYFIYTERVIIDKKASFNIYSGAISQKSLESAVSGDNKISYEAIIESLEAGETAYNERKIEYENLKN